MTLLAERLEELLDEVLRRSGGDVPVPAVTPSEPAGRRPLDQPVEEEFKVGTMALAWDPDDEQVVIEAQEVTETEEEPEVGDDDPAIAVLRVRISAPQARAFAERALKVVAAGRPRARCAGCRWTATGTSARARTGTWAEMTAPAHWNTAACWIMGGAAGRMGP